MMKRIIFFVSLIFCVSAFSWNSVGHRIIAQIAYTQLTPLAKEKIDALTAVMFHSRYASNRFSQASTWPDKIKKQTPAYNAWHYINLPIVKNNIQPQPVNPENVVWAITRAEKKVSDVSLNPHKRAMYLSFLIHFVGDSAQPLHCATLYSALFLHGDRGGNDYRIDSPIANNLHQLWDRGVGLFYSSRQQYLFHYFQVEKIANAWMNRYPKTVFAKQLAEQSPTQWAQDSHALAVTVAYAMPENTVPSSQYIQRSQEIVREQTVLAGYRLADILNHLFA